MRSHICPLVSVLFAAVLLLCVLSGCSSDSNTTIPTDPQGPIIGSVDDPVFLGVKPEIDNLADSVVTYFLHALNACKGLSNAVTPVQYTVVPDGESWLNTDYGEGWHIIDLTNLAASGAFTVHDSIRFTRNGSISQTPIGAESIRYVHNYQHHFTGYGLLDSTVGRCDITLSGLYATTTTAEGVIEVHVYRQYQSNDSTVIATYDGTVELNNFRFSQAATGLGLDAFDDFNHCPLEGTVSATIYMTYSKDGSLPYTLPWGIDFSFQDGAVSGTVSCGNTIWSYDCVVCSL